MRSESSSIRAIERTRRRAQTKTSIPITRTTATVRAVIATKTTTRGTQGGKAAIMHDPSFARGVSHGDAPQHPRQHDPATPTVTTTTTNAPQAIMGAAEATETEEEAAEVVEDQAEEGMEEEEEGGIRRLP